jgi:hypothetical protein
VAHPVSRTAARAAPAQTVATKTITRRLDFTTGPSPRAFNTGLSPRGILTVSYRG